MDSGETEVHLTLVVVRAGRVDTVEHLLLQQRAAEQFITAWPSVSAPIPVRVEAGNRWTRPFLSPTVGRRGELKRGNVVTAVVCFSMACLFLVLSAVLWHWGGQQGQVPGVSNCCPR